MDFNFGAFEGLMIFFALFALATLVFDVVMLVDAINRPPELYPSPEQKTWWIVGLVVGLATALPAIVVAIAYYVAVKKPAAVQMSSWQASASPAGTSAPPPPAATAPPTLNCRNCGAKLVAGSRFCHSCGTPTT
jgi:zinc ribbon protein